MSAILTGKSPRAGRPHWIWASACLLAILTGCAASPKGNTAKAGDSPSAGKSPPAKSSPAATPQRQSKTAAPQAEQSSKRQATPADKPTAAKPAGADSEAAWSSLQTENGQPMTDEEREALAEMIRAAVVAGQKEHAQDPAQPAAQPAAAKAPQAQAAPAKAADSTAKPASPAAATVAQAGTAEAPKKEGCGATTGDPIDLTPPPTDQPQPKFACATRKVVSEGTWGGKSADFTFTIGNDGQAPLAVRLKGG